MSPTMNSRLVDLPFYRLRGELIDSISFAIHCVPEDKYLLIRETNTDTWWLPSMQVWNKNWRLSSKMLINKVFGKPSDRTCGKIIKLCKVWHPPPRPTVYHCVFLVSIEEDLKKPILNDSLRASDTKWIKLEDLKAFANTFNILSPEVADYFSKANIERAISYSNYRRMSGSDFEQFLVEKTWKHTLAEITESYAIITSTVEWPSGLSNSGLFPPAPSILHQELIKAAKFSEKDQCIIYEEFLQLCFPSLFMNNTIFQNFLINMGWKKTETPFLFRAADVFNRGALSYRDFIYILAATEPTTFHGGSSGELRCRYLFRYLDVNQNDMLDYNEFKVMQKMILESKKLPTDENAVDKEAEINAKAIGIGPNMPITRDDFLRAMGQLKLRGSSSLLRSPISVITFLLEKTKLSMNLIQYKFWPSTSEFHTPCKIQSSIRFPSTDIFSKEVSKKEDFGDYSFHDHTVVLDRFGKVREILGIEEFTGSMSASCYELQCKNMIHKISSTDNLSPHTVPSSLLSLLHYFESSGLQFGKATQKGTFSWGELDLSSFGSHILQICEIAEKIFKNEPRVLEVSSPIYIMGDLHGNFADLKNFSNIFWQQGPLFSPANFLFLGDYVDRGPHGIEVISYLFSYKVIAPTKLFLVRGNHEIRSIQRNFTFFGECINKFGKELGLCVWESINKVFDCLPIASVIDRKIFCCHGGIPPPWLFKNWEDLNKIPCPLPNPETSPLAWNIMWNDPLQYEVTDEDADDNGFFFNIQRNTGHLFNSQALDNFLNAHDLSLLVRAHQIVQSGYQIIFNKKLITIFSSSSYCGGNNNASCLFACKKKIRVFLIGPRVQSIEANVASISCSS